MTKTLPQCFIGFDGFTDEIVTPVKERIDSETFTPYPTIASFGQRILESKDQSCNIELVTKQIKLGGNAPILANALLELDYPVTLAATIGNHNAIEPLFQTLADRCKQTIPLGPSGYSEAIEFEDGKIILGKHAPLLNLNYERIIQAIGKKNLIECLDQASLFVSTNWTMLPGMTAIWKNIQKDILPHLSFKKRWLFVDIADPAKRSDRDLIDCLEILKAFKKTYQIALGLNMAEAARVAHTLKLSASDPQAIQKATEFDQIVIHHKRSAAAADNQKLYSQTSFYVEKPTLSTGAGDNFNAGYCAGLLQGLDMQECLRLGVGVSGFYVRYGKSPTQAQLDAFLK